MKIQQHYDVVVDAAGSRQGFAKRKRGGEVLQREREAPRARVRLPSLPPLYIGALGGAGPRRCNLQGGGGQGVASPQAKWGAPPPLGFPNPRRRGGPRGGAPAH